MPADVLAATLLAPGRLELRHYPYPDRLEPGAVLLQMLASGICGTDKHTFRGETQQYAGTDHASSTPFPIIQGHENVGVVAALGDGGARARSTARRWRSATVSCPRPNRACGECEYCRGDFPYYFCRRLENYGNSLTSAEPPHLFGGWSEYLYLRPGTPVFKVPESLPTEVAVLTELFAVTHSLDLAAAMPRPGGFREGDTVAIVGAGPVGIVHAAKARIMGASAVIAVDPFGPRLGVDARARRHAHVDGERHRRRCRSSSSATRPAAAVSTSWSTPPGTRRASCRRSTCCATAAR